MAIMDISGGGLQAMSTRNSPRKGVRMCREIPARASGRARVASRRRRLDRNMESSSGPRRRSRAEGRLDLEQRLHPMSAQDNLRRAAIDANTAPLRAKASNYPEPFFSRMGKRQKRPLGDLFALKNFGVNLTRLLPGGESALLHRHSKQDELVYILEGNPTLVTDAGEELLRPGMCAGFPASGCAHQLVNRTDRDVVYLEIGDRTPGDQVVYPSDDLQASRGPDGTWGFARKDGTPY
jgi:uncharacterized cupin superfamily protein